MPDRGDTDQETGLLVVRAGCSQARLFEQIHEAGQGNC